MQVSRDGLVLHLSEHHGDCCPGSTVFVWMTGIEAFHREVTGKNYKYLRPGIETTFYYARCVEVTVGNLSENPRAFLFLMDYANRQRVKLWDTARVVEDDAGLPERSRDPDHPGKVEQAILFTVEAWDINCPQHIHQRSSQRQVQPVIEQLRRRVSELEARLAQRQADDPSPAPAWDGP
jgi:hypothetical protein